MVVQTKWSFATDRRLVFVTLDTIFATYTKGVEYKFVVHSVK